jgi:trans-aconitate methyltransferase
MNWNDYLTATKNSSPRSLLLEAIKYVKEEDNALDLGAGALNDTRFLLEQGFAVEAVDSNPTILEYAANLPQDAKVTFTVSTFDQYNFPKNVYDLVSAQYALPFNPPETFDKVFSKITDSLKAEGVFTGQFFGPEDEWSTRPNMTFHTKEDIKALLAPYSIHKLEETKGIRPTAVGPDKFWHVFKVIASKKSV